MVVNLVEFSLKENQHANGVVVRPLRGLSRQRGHRFSWFQRVFLRAWRSQSWISVSVPTLIEGNPARASGSNRHSSFPHR